MTKSAVAPVQNRFKTSPAGAVMSQCGNVSAGCWNVEQETEATYIACFQAIYGFHLCI